MYVRVRTCPTQFVDPQSSSCPSSSRSILAWFRIMMSRSYTPERFTSAAFRDLYSTTKAFKTCTAMYFYYPVALSG